MLKHWRKFVDKVVEKIKVKSLTDLQDEDLSLARAYADAHQKDFDDKYLLQLEISFNNKGTLTTHQWAVLQKTIEKYEMHDWEEKGNK